MIATRLRADRLDYLTAMHASLTRQAVPWEAVIALDGADPSLLPAPLAADDRVRVLALPRPVGAACARNLALTQVRTPYVNWADDDDLFPDHAMSTRLEVLQRTDAGWCAGWSEDLHPDGSTTSESAQPESVVSTGPVPVPRTPTGDASSYEHGPLAVVDADGGEVFAYCVGGLVLDVPAKSLPALVEWVLGEARLGAERLHPSGQDADPLLVLTEAACERFGLPVRLSREEGLAGRLPEDHKVLKQLARAEWKLTRRGFGPWARIYRPARGSRRSCVQLCIPAWNALDVRHWNGASQLPPAELVRLLGGVALPDAARTPRSR